MPTVCIRTIVHVRIVHPVGAPSRPLQPARALALEAVDDASPLVIGPRVRRLRWIFATHDSRMPRIRCGRYWSNGCLSVRATLPWSAIAELCPRRPAGKRTGPLLRDVRRSRGDRGSACRVVGAALGDLRCVGGLGGCLGGGSEAEEPSIVHDDAVETNRHTLVNKNTRGCKTPATSRRRG